MTHSSSMTSIPVGLDDGYAYTKLALPDGRLIIIPSRARVGQSGVTWIDQAEQRIFEYGVCQDSCRLKFKVMPPFFP